MNAVIEKMRIRYIKLHFTLVIMEDGALPRTKVCVTFRRTALSRE